MKEIITQNIKNDKRVSSSIIIFLKNIIEDYLRLSNAYKSKGIPVVTLFQYFV